MKYLIALATFVCAFAAAEPSFNQIESLIQDKNYGAAAQGLEQIVHNHPNSAKAWYAMAQAQAGLGNLDRARVALDKATGLDPELKFASSSNVQNLRDAVTPQAKKIEAIEESHFWRNLFIFLLFCGSAYLLYWYFTKKDDEEDKPVSKPEPEPIKPAPAATTTEARPAMQTPPPAPQPPPSYVQPTHTPVYVAPAPQTTVVHTNSSDGFITGVLVADMMNHHHHETHVVEREIVREVPVVREVSSRDSSWDSDSSSSRSSSWDSGSSSSDSSWSSSSSSDSSWDSGSSDSSSGSDSSW